MFRLPGYGKSLSSMKFALSFCPQCIKRSPPMDFSPTYLLENPYINNLLTFTAADLKDYCTNPLLMANL